MVEKNVKVFRQIGDDLDARSDMYGIDCSKDGLCHGEFAEECDINLIVRRFGLTGALPTAVSMPTYGDFTGVSDVREAFELMREAEEEFMGLDAQLRFRFNNDPISLLEFLDNPANRDEAIKLGLVEAASPMEPKATAGDAAPPKAEGEPVKK